MSLLFFVLWSFGAQGSPAKPADGRLVVHVENAKVTAASVKVHGPMESTRDRNGQPEVTFEQLPPGDYDVEPVYDGGVSGASKKVHVDSNQTARLTLAPEALGAVQLIAVDATCSATVDFGVRRLGQPDPGRGMPPMPAVAGRGAGAGVTLFLGGQQVTIVASFQRMLGGCFRVVGGLQPGSYQAFYNSQAGLLAIKAFEVVEQQVTTAAVGPPAATLDGRVLYNGQPPAGLGLRLTGRASGPLNVALGADGRYRVLLPTAGDYSVTFSRGDGVPSLMLSTTVTVADGANTFDWNAVAGAIAIAIKGWDRRMPVQVTVQGSGGLLMNTIDGAGAYPIRIEGQRLGTYSVSAYQRDAGLAARAPATVTLDEAHPVASVELELIRHSGSFVLQDASGAPVIGASIHGVMTDFIRMTAPGVYPSGTISPGVPLTITAPGFVPACTIAPDEPRTITLARGRALEFVFEQALVVPNYPSGELEISPGSPGCRMALRSFAFTKLATAPGAFPRFKIEGLPLGDELIWANGADRRVLTVPATGPVVIK